MLCVLKAKGLCINRKKIKREALMKRQPPPRPDHHHINVTWQHCCVPYSKIGMMCLNSEQEEERMKNSWVMLCFSPASLQ